MSNQDLTAADVVRAWKYFASEESIAGHVVARVRDDCTRSGLKEGLLGMEPIPRNGIGCNERYQRGYALGAEARRLMGGDDADI